jgi:hypothetical protein
MTPHGDLLSTGFALTNLGQQYLIDEPSGGSVTVDLCPPRDEVAESDQNAQSRHQTTFTETKPSDRLPRYS